MERPVIAGVGEILFDIVGDSEELGGAPINFAYHASMLGAEGYAVSTIGDDTRGRRALAELSRRKVPTSCITTIKGYATGYVLARVDGAGVASYEFPDDIAWDHLAINDAAAELASRLDGVCFGSLVQRGEHSRRVLTDYLSMLPEKALKIFDINLRQNFYSAEVVLGSIALADIIKLNDDELQILAEMAAISGSEQEILDQLVAKHDLTLAVLTRGDRGSLLVRRGEVSDHPGIRTENIGDTIGAGDAFTAATVISLLNNYSLDDINEKANRVAAWVCSQKGAMPEMPSSFKI
ncbi:PfkB family carbohydrate kinase [Desulfosediminicola ganghwensis]|uniref:PfkB family carbohydrate kinase n=1 Tax=Desulfosediminicola ganghwensis TaxID=2569540 RepID=UPI0010ABD7EC|nr:PfkB family carbohydrate kinase [Desulfosediminicola ganghwensis]